MANDLNQCNFIGRAGKDPEIRYAPSGTAVCNFSIAVGYKYKDEESVEWIRIVTFGKLAELIAKYVFKGSRVFVSGRMQAKSWEDKDGTKRYTTEIIANTVQFLSSKGDSVSPGEANAEDDGEIPF